MLASWPLSQSGQLAIVENVRIGADYDVTNLTKYKNSSDQLRILESWIGKPPREYGEPIKQWHKDVAAVAQQVLEQILTDLVDYNINKHRETNVCLAGGVFLNCKANKKIRELDSVGDLFIQPVSNDAGVGIGGALYPFSPEEVDPMESLYFGPSYSNPEIRSVLRQNKLDVKKSDNIYTDVAQYLAAGKLVGWFQGRTELGPRALGNRSILADPRSISSRDNVNEYVKHREKWRPFAPSILEEEIEEYLVDSCNAPYMIQTFDVRPEKTDEIPAVLHPNDDTVRAQTVNEQQNPRYHQLIKEFDNITGVPVVLNTSFNDSGEPIVNHPREAIRDFYSMGLDVLAINDYLLEK